MSGQKVFTNDTGERINEGSFYFDTGQNNVPDHDKVCLITGVLPERVDLTYIATGQHSTIQNESYTRGFRLLSRENVVNMVSVLRDAASKMEEALKGKNGN